MPDTGRSASDDRVISVVGLGYVGLPVAVAFGKLYRTVGFDRNAERVEDLRRGHDATREVDPGELASSNVLFTDRAEDLKKADFHIVSVPTPVDAANRPDLGMLFEASETVGGALKPGDIVVYESTVYPGATEKECVPILEQVSGLKQGEDFEVGYSPERINPGDEEHRFTKISKVVAAGDEETLETVARVYESVLGNGVYRARSIEVAEAAKVIENVQRDLNIALMNELALILDRMNIRTRDVLEAAATKWNFLPFTPGLVGGHCVGVDPYYLTAQAEEIGYHPQVILAGRRINDGMGLYVAQRTVKMLIGADLLVKGARVGILGLTFKENVPDIRNSRVPDIVVELRQFGVDPLVHDPLADAGGALRKYGIRLVGWEELADLDGLIYAVDHDFYRKAPQKELLARLRPGGILADVKSVLDPETLPASVHYWSL